MQRHRTSTLTAIAAIATLGALVGAALIVRPARATPSTGVGTTILAQSLFDEIRAKAHTPLLSDGRPSSRPTGNPTSMSSTTSSRREGPAAGTRTRVPA